jgi:hypothetical protein
MKDLMYWREGVGMIPSNHTSKWLEVASERWLPNLNTTLPATRSQLAALPSALQCFLVAQLLCNRVVCCSAWLSHQTPAYLCRLDCHRLLVTQKAGFQKVGVLNGHIEALEEMGARTMEKERKKIKPWA